MLDALAVRYGQRPSRFIGGLNEFESLTLDYRCAVAGWTREQKAAAKARG